MPRYMIERTFPEGLYVAINDTGADNCASIIGRNLEGGVTWVQSFVSKDRNYCFCIYDGPSPEAIRVAALKSALPVDRITEIQVLDPYFYH